jgi:murein L,D-transpeptidase YafK
MAHWLQRYLNRVEGLSDARNASRTATVAGLAVALAIVGLSLVYHLADQHIPDVFARRIGTADRIIVDKSARRLFLMRGGRVLLDYRITLGANPVARKEIQGDSRTPEGVYTIDRRLAASSFHRALHISYPNVEDRRFADAIKRPPGGAIMIHGQPNDLGWIERLTRSRDWTDGCIAVSNRAIEELWDAVPDGTPITILP